MTCKNVRFSTNVTVINYDENDTTVRTINEFDLKPQQQQRDLIDNIIYSIKCSLAKKKYITEEKQTKIA